MMKRARIEVDRSAQAIYVDLGTEDRAVVSTVEVTPSLLVDLDSYGMAVGVEILTLSVRGLPLEELNQKCHFRPEHMSLLAQLPSLVEHVAGSSAVAGTHGEGAIVDGGVLA